MSDKVRVRFAPSPTGNIHVGNVRTAILNYLFAKNSGGTYILRIEDTDKERSTLESEEKIIDQLSWLGLDWDEGPLKGGDYGPYRQSERVATHQEHVTKLLESGKAYYCYLTDEELAKFREETVATGKQPDFYSIASAMTDEKKAEYESKGHKPVVRFIVPNRPIIVNDLVQGEVVFEGENISDFVIQRQDGSSPYNFAAAVDDSTMEITHVIRGNDHLSNTPKQVMLYEAFGYEVPKFAHTPMIMGEDGARLSKRHGHTSVAEFREAGFMPEVLLNFLSLLSWSSETGDEILSVDRLISEFTFSRILKSAAKFDREKFNWMNGQYIRALEPKERLKRAIAVLDEAGVEYGTEEHLAEIVEALRERVETFQDYITSGELFFKETIEVTGEEEIELVEREGSQKVFAMLADAFKEMDEISGETFKAAMKTIQTETGVKGKDLWMPVRVALTGQMHGPELPAILEIFGKEKCIRQLENAIKK